MAQLKHQRAINKIDEALKYLDNYEKKSQPTSQTQTQTKDEPSHNDQVTTKNDTVDDSQDSKDEMKEVDFDYMKSVWDKYDSIQNFKADPKHKKSMETIEYLKETNQASDDMDWVATEKVHGCNFSILTNGKDLFGARRGAVLKPGESFIGGWEKLIEKEKPRILKLYQLMTKENSDVTVVIVYGEICGRAVQKGIFYSPDLLFYAFDIKTNIEKESERLEYYQSRQLFKESGLFHGDILIQGKLDDVIKFDVNSFQSTIPKLLGLPDPVDNQTGKIIDNLAEGIVVRKLKGSNFLLKIKAAKFDEIVAKATVSKKQQRKMKNQSKNNNKASIEEVRKTTVDIVGESFVDFIDSCMNENRFAAVVSKMGQLTQDNSGKIRGMLFQDINKELMSEKKDEMKAVPKKKQGLIKKYISAVAAEFVENKVKQL